MNARPTLMKLCLAAACAGATLASVALHADETLSGMPDPTRPSTATGEGTEGAPNARYGMVLQSVLVAPQRRLAVINGQTLAVGERIGTATVVAIRPHEVVVRRGNEDVILRLLPRYVSRSASTKTESPSGNPPNAGTR